MEILMFHYHVYNKNLFKLLYNCFHVMRAM